MWYYKQDFIRKSVWPTAILKQNLSEVKDWLEGMASASSGDPLPAQNMVQAREVFSRLYILIDQGHVSGRLWDLV